MSAKYFMSFVNSSKTIVMNFILNVFDFNLIVNVAFLYMRVFLVRRFYVGLVESNSFHFVRKCEIMKFVASTNCIQYVECCFSSFLLFFFLPIVTFCIVSMLYICIYAEC